MKEKAMLLCLLFLLPFLGSHTVEDFQPLEEKVSFSQNSTPPNEEAIVRMLMEKGVIGKNAGPAEKEAALREYLQGKLVKDKIEEKEDKGKLVGELARYRELPRTVQARALDAGFSGPRGARYENLLRGRKRPSRMGGVKEKEWEGEVHQAKLLVLLAEFSGDQQADGPLHNQMTAPDNNSDLWVEDFNTGHYRNMLFTSGGYDAIDQNGNTLHLDSMVDFYLEQSGGSFAVDGDVYGWFTLPHSEAYYGDDDPEGGHDNLAPGTPSDLVEDLMVLAREQGVPFEDYDLEDPFDLDEDGDFHEPDGIIDHLTIVHAGRDQSGGGGAQGDDAIWAHSSSVFVEIPSDNPTVSYWDGNMIAYNYIIQGEDGTIGVFCHEFGHDIGLPDEYDTKYSGNGEPVGFYSLMSSGSWTGKPLGTKPASFSPWAKIELGKIWGGQWVQPTEINLEDIPFRGKKYKLDQAQSVGQNNQVIQVNLPQHRQDLIPPYNGSFQWYSGKGDEIDQVLITALTLPPASLISLDFYTWFSIEEEWDYGFVQVSEDDGETWTSLVSGLMSYDFAPGGYPAIESNLPGYTGESGGWVADSLDLTPYAGKEILLQFRYITDWGQNELGFFIDDVVVLADGNIIFTDSGENGGDNWSTGGWELNRGFHMKDHYYLLEWRTHNKTDEALKYAYTFEDYDAGIARYFTNEPGLLIWYRDMAYTDNWVGEHPGHVYLGIVDAHPIPFYEETGDAFRTRVQLHDAAFNFRSVRPKLFYSSGEEPMWSPWVPPVIHFSDDRLYWYDQAPSSGLKLFNYGLEISLMGTSRDRTVASVWVKSNQPRR